MLIKVSINNAIILNIGQYNEEKYRTKNLLDSYIRLINLIEILFIKFQIILLRTIG